LTVVSAVARGQTCWARCKLTTLLKVALLLAWKTPPSMFHGSDLAAANLICLIVLASEIEADPVSVGVGAVEVVVSWPSKALSSVPLADTLAEMIVPRACARWWCSRW